MHVVHYQGASGVRGGCAMHPLAFISSFKLSKITTSVPAALHHVAGGVKAGIGQPQGRDHAVATTLRGAQRHKEHLVGIMLDDVPQLPLQLRPLAWIQVALEDGILPRASVVYGVALLAQQLYGDKPTQAPPLLQSVSTNELGLRVLDTETDRRVFQPMIPKNVPLPTQATRLLYADTRKTPDVMLEILQRKDAFLEPETLGEHVFSGLPKGHAARPIEIVLGYDRDGRVTVNAVDEESGHRMEVAVRDDTESDLIELHQRLERLPLLG